MVSAIESQVPCCIVPTFIYSYQKGSYGKNDGKFEKSHICFARQNQAETTKQNKISPGTLGITYFKSHS